MMAAFDFADALFLWIRNFLTFAVWRSADHGVKAATPPIRPL